MTSNPSNADSTEIAGVSAQSPYTSAAPNMPMSRTSAVPPRRPTQKRHQCENATFAFIVHSEGQDDVFHSGDDDERPHNQRQRAENCLRSRMRTRGVEHDLQRVERAGADVAIDHTKGG